TVHAPLISGMKVVLVPRFDPKGCFAQIKKEHILFIPGVPALFERLYPYFQKYNLHDLKLMVSGGDRVSAELAAKYNELLARDHASIKFRAGYGLTEASGTCTLVPNEYDTLPTGCIGIPMTGTKICVVMPGTNDPVPFGEEGELCFLGPALMNGYYKNEEATHEVMRLHADGNVWLHTGDIVAIRKDGGICFRSRYKRMVKVNGFNVYPSLIEEAVQNHPAVKQVCAVSIPWRVDRKIKLFVVLNEGANPATIESELIEYSKDKMNRWSVPVRVEVLEALPMTKFNKVDYMLLEKQEAAKAKAAAEGK
ncbi:MAG: class I adenylate-forming enzyme family protein, partial [Methanocorpusculum sp.]|nr:class I adenylate-forming enzyme family protein [Methanocorpusculum sp.]